MDRAQRFAAAGKRHPFDFPVDPRMIMASLARDTDDGRTLYGQRKMAAPAANIMMATQQCPVGKGKRKAIRYRAGGKGQHGLDIAGQPEPAGPAALSLASRARCPITDSGSSGP